MISIIIPAFNEEKRIGASLEKLASFLKTRKEDFEILIVDDASTDNTGKVVETFKPKTPNLRVLRLEKSPYAGKGLAVNRGTLAAKGSIVIFTDADFSTPIGEIDKLLEKIKSGYDIAIGSRALDRSLVKKRQSPLRELMGRVFNVLVRLLVVPGIVDTQCGFKAFDMAACKILFENERIFDFGFDVELLFLARKRGLKIAEVPVYCHNDPASRVHPIKDAFSMFLDLLKIRFFHAEKKGSVVDRLFYYLHRYRTFFKFSTVGVSNTIVDFGLFYALTRVTKMDLLIANPISVETAIIWSFFWNNLWTFSKIKNQRPLAIRFFIFQFVSLGALILSQDVLFILNRFLGVFDLFAKAATIPAVLIFNYSLNSRWTFRNLDRGRGAWYLYTGFILLFLVIYSLL